MIVIYSYSFEHLYGGTYIANSYDKLWAILNERNMMKAELIREAKISTNAMA